MKRRDFIRVAGIAGGSAFALPNASYGMLQQQPPIGFANSKVAIGRGVFGEPKNAVANKPESSKMPGTMVSLTADKPNGVSPFLVTLFVQFWSTQVAQWQFVQCDSRFANVYSFRGFVRDLHQLSEGDLKVTLFVPDAAHDLPPQVRVRIRSVIRFYTVNNQLINDLDQVLTEETVTPQKLRGRRTIDFMRGDKNPPFEILDLSNGNAVPL